MEFCGVVAHADVNTVFLVEKRNVTFISLELPRPTCLTSLTWSRRALFRHLVQLRPSGLLTGRILWLELIF